MKRVARSAVLACLALAAAHGVLAEQAAPPRYAGRSLVDALADLRRAGLPLVYSSELVTVDLRVAEPSAKSPRAILEELLAVHGLAVQAGRNTLLVVAVKPRVQLPNATHTTATPPPGTRATCSSRGDAPRTARGDCCVPADVRSALHQRRRERTLRAGRNGRSAEKARAHIRLLLDHASRVGRLDRMPRHIRGRRNRLAIARSGC